MTENKQDKQPETTDNQEEVAKPENESAEAEPNQEPLELNEEYKENAPEPLENGGDLAAQVQALNEKTREQNEKILRLMADTENLRRRKDREIIDKEKYAIAKFAKEILSIGDNIQRAMEATPKDAMESDSALKSLFDGVQMTEREFLNILGRYDIQKIESEGQPFDPNLHQAMFEVPNPDLPKGTIVQVVQTGYTLGERTLRPALVGISKGGSAEAAPKVAEESKEESKEPPEIPTKNTKPSEEEKSKPEQDSAPKSDKEKVGQKIDKSA